MQNALKDFFKVKNLALNYYYLLNLNFHFGVQLGSSRLLKFPTKRFLPLVLLHNFWSFHHGESWLFTPLLEFSLDSFPLCSPLFSFLCSFWRLTHRNFDRCYKFHHSSWVSLGWTFLVAPATERCHYCKWLPGPWTMKYDYWIWKVHTYNCLN